MQIKSYWQRETGRWSDIQNKFTGKIKSGIEEKILDIRIDKSPINNKSIVKFIGGPTGFESYYVEDILDNPFGDHKDHENFCICGGTINSWPTCWVKTKDFYDILEVLNNV